MLPLLAFLAFVWFERRYLQIIYYDFTSQLEPQHRVYNLLWCACPASCGPRALQTSRPAHLAPCRPRALQTSPPSERPAGLAQASHQSVDATGGVGLLLQPEDLHRSSSLAGDACRRADNAYQQRAAPLLLPPQHPRVHRLGASLGHSPGRCRLPSPCAHLKQTCVLSLRLSQSARLTPGARVPRRFVGCTACGSCGASLGTWQREARCPE